MTTKFLYKIFCLNLNAEVCESSEFQSAYKEKFGVHWHDVRSKTHHPRQHEWTRFISFTSSCSLSHQTKRSFRHTASVVISPPNKSQVLVLPKQIYFVLTSFENLPYYWRSSGLMNSTASRWTGTNEISHELYLLHSVNCVRDKIASAWLAILFFGV